LKEVTGVSYLDSKVSSHGEIQEKIIVISSETVKLQKRLIKLHKAYYLPLLMYKPETWMWTEVKWY
jgi:hypothetical protein